jgi:hypothetical protein
MEGQDAVGQRAVRAAAILRMLAAGSTPMNLT